MLFASARRFAQAAAAFEATALLSNHTEFDNAYFKAHTAAALRGLPSNRPRDADVPNPFSVGQRRVVNYMAVVELCAMSAKPRAIGSP